MKFINKSFIIGMIASIIVTSSVVFASVTIGGITLNSSSDVIFDNTGTSIVATNVQDALDKLYTKANTKFAYSTAANYNGSVGRRTATKTTTLTVSKGIYLVIGRCNYTARSSSGAQTRSITESSSDPTLTYTTGTCTELKSLTFLFASTAKSASNYYAYGREYQRIWKCNFPSSTTLTATTDYTGSLSAATTVTSDLGLEAFKVFSN